MRSLIVVLGGCAVGAAPDAVDYGDAGANTLGHLLEAAPDLRLPMLMALGLGNILGCPPRGEPLASWGRMVPRSPGKDSTSGHWEMAGIILNQPLGTFERFPDELVQSIEREANVQLIGNVAASGAQIIGDLGEEHMATRRPILYTSADSVLQIAAHEKVIPQPRLHEICRIARRHADPYRIGRVIARPFAGQPGSFYRTPGRRDYSIDPPRTVLNVLSDAGVPTIAIGKAHDLFNGSGVTRSHPTTSDTEGMDTISQIWPGTPEGLILANLVDFDAIYGHRRDPRGFARALAQFDRWLEDFLPQVSLNDLLIITADHGNDPTFRGTDHTREEVPLLVRYGPFSANLGTRSTLADVAATLTDYFGIAAWPVGSSVIPTAQRASPLLGSRQRHVPGLHG